MFLFLMSAKRSWDVQREPTRSAPVAPRPASPKNRQSLKARRSERKKKLGIALLILLVILLCGLVYLIWQPFVRIQEVTAEGPHAETVKQVAEESLWGTYGYVLPKNSIFMSPEIYVRERILEAHPDIVAVSISRTGFTSISVKGVPRTSAFIWCGPTALETGSCYEADAEGLVYAQISETQLVAFDTASTTEVIAAKTMPEVLHIYAPLAYPEEGDGTPIRAHVVGAQQIPNILRFVKAMNLLGVRIDSVEIRADEADLYTPEGTRITYILGKEEAAAALAASSFPTLNIPSGVYLYVDLRFDGKVYVKRHAGEAVVEEEEVR